MVWLVPVALVGLFMLRGARRLHADLLPGLRRPARSSRRCAAQIFDRYLHLPVAFFDRQASGMLLSRLTYNTEQVATATTDSITVFIRDTLTIIGLIGYLLYLNPKLTLISLVVAPLIACADPPHQPAVPPLQPAHPELDGRRDARRQGGDRGAASRARVQRAGLPGGVVRAGDRAQPALAHEADAHQGPEQPGRADHHGARASPPCSTSRPSRPSTARCRWASSLRSSRR